MMDPVLSWLASLVLFALFATSGWHKLYYPSYYRSLIRSYIPVSLSLAVAGQVSFGTIEIAVATGLLLAPVRSLSAWLAAALLFFYLLLILSSLVRGRDMDCGCSGPAGEQRISPWLLLRNTVLIGLAVAAAAPPVADRTMGVADGLVVAFAGLAAVLFYLSFEQLLNNRGRLASLRNH